MRVVLVYRGDSLELPAGETVVGRALTCRLRFNDPAVSRVHARFIVADGAVTLTDLGSTNGTRVNGADLRRPQRLQSGDQIQIGHRWLQVEFVAMTEPGGDEPQTIDRQDDWKRSRDHGEAEEETLDRGTTWQPRSRQASNIVQEETIDGVSAWQLSGSLPAAADNGGFASSTGAMRNCPHCRQVVPSTVEVCPQCDYQWPAGRPSSVTQRIKLEAIDRRVGKRKVVEIPVLYASETLTLDTVARDLSRGGMFVASELLDPINTSCNITVLPDGGPAISLAGVVCHVVQTETGEAGRPPGLGVKFTALSPAAEQWLSTMLEDSTPPAAEQRTTGRNSQK